MNKGVCQTQPHKLDQNGKKKKCGFLTFKIQTPNKTGMKTERWRDFAGVLSLFG